MEQDDDADYDRKLSQLRREEELINEEAKEAAAFLQTDIPVIRPGQVFHRLRLLRRCHLAACSHPWPAFRT